MHNYVKLKRNIKSGNKLYLINLFASTMLLPQANSYSFKMTFVFLAPRNNGIDLTEEKAVKILFVLFIRNRL